MISSTVSETSQELLFIPKATVTKDARVNGILFGNDYLSDYPVFYFCKV
jgi:hypothetical protein